MSVFAIVDVESRRHFVAGIAGELRQSRRDAGCVHRQQRRFFVEGAFGYGDAVRLHAPAVEVNGHRLLLRAGAAGIRELGLQHACTGIAAILLLYGRLAALLQTGEHELAAGDGKIERAWQRRIRRRDCECGRGAHHRVRRIALWGAAKSARAAGEMFRAADMQRDAGCTGWCRVDPGDGRHSGGRCASRRQQAKRRRMDQRARVRAHDRRRRRRGSGVVAQSLEYMPNRAAICDDLGLHHKLMPADRLLRETERRGFKPSPCPRERRVGIRRLQLGIGARGRWPDRLFGAAYRYTILDTSSISPCPDPGIRDWRRRRD